MADNVTLNPGAAGDVIRTKDKGTYETQVVLLDLGGAGAENLLTDAMPIAGNVANGAADTGNPTKVGFKALAVGSNPTAVNPGQRIDALATVHGQLLVTPGHPGLLVARKIYTAAAANDLMVSITTGKPQVVSCSIMAGADNLGNPSVLVGLDTTTIPTTAQVVLSHPGLPAGLSHNESMGGAPIVVGANGDDIRVTVGAFTSGSIEVLVRYYVLPQ